MPMHHWNPFSKERKLERKDLWIGWMMSIGLVGFACSIPFIVIFAFVFRDWDGAMKILDVVKWSPLVFISMYISGLFFGIYSEKSQHQGSRRVRHNCRIIARYAITKDHTMLTDESEFEFHDKLRYYVKILDPEEGSLEFECTPPVYYGCGEGMMGDAEIQGVWLGAFRPYMGVQQTHVGQTF
jgi:hypothetical protein